MSFRRHTPSEGNPDLPNQPFTSLANNNHSNDLADSATENTSPTRTEDIPSVHVLVASLPNETTHVLSSHGDLPFTSTEGVNLPAPIRSSSGEGQDILHQSLDTSFLRSALEQSLSGAVYTNPAEGTQESSNPVVNDRTPLLSAAEHSCAILSPAPHAMGSSLLPANTSVMGQPSMQSNMPPLVPSGVHRLAGGVTYTSSQSPRPYSGISRNDHSTSRANPSTSRPLRPPVSAYLPYNPYLVGISRPASRTVSQSPYMQYPDRSRPATPPYEASSLRTNQTTTLPAQPPLCAQCHSNLSSDNRPSTTTFDAHGRLSHVDTTSTKNPVSTTDSEHNNDKEAAKNSPHIAAPVPREASTFNPTYMNPSLINVSDVHHPRPYHHNYYNHVYMGDPTVTDPAYEFSQHYPYYQEIHDSRPAVEFNELRQMYERREMQINRQAQLRSNRSPTQPYNYGAVPPREADHTSNKRRGGSGGFAHLSASVKGGHGRFLFYTPSIGTITAPSFEEIGLDVAIQSGNRKRESIPKSGTVRRVSTISISATSTINDELGEPTTKHDTEHKGEAMDNIPSTESDTQKAADRFANLLCEGPFWLDVTAPTDIEMRTLSKIFRIHPLTAEDIMTEDTREKCELFRNYYFICFRSFDADPHSDTYLEPLSVFTVVMREGIISFHHRPTPHARNVLRRIRQLTDYVTISSDWINYALIDDITDAFAPLIGNLQLEVDSIDELVLILKESEQSDMLRRIGHARKKVMTAMRLLGAKADVMRGLIKRCDDRVGGEIGLYLGDIQDHLITMLQNVAHYEKIIARAHSNYLAQISIELTQTSNLTNDVMTKLTVLGTILVPMNVVTGLWGMNVEVPGRDIEGLSWFFGIIIGMSLLGATLYVYLRRNKVV